MSHTVNNDILSGALGSMIGQNYVNNSQNNGGVLGTITTMALSNSIPSFWADRPHLWFAQFETITSNSQANEEQKIQLLVRSLLPENLEYVNDILSKQQSIGKYLTLKKRLIEIYEVPDSKEIEINFDNPFAVYYAGNSVNGQVVVKLGSVEKVKSITVIIKGEANVKWVEEPKEANNPEAEPIHFTSHEKYFEARLIVLQGAGTSYATIEPGVNVYNFTTVLPSTLPSSFEGKFGHVRYTAKVIVERPWKFDQGKKIAFTVISPLNLNQHQKTLVPIRLEKEKDVGCLCCLSGPLSVNIEIPFSGFVSGQYMPIAVNIDNQTNRNLTSNQLTLKKVVTFKSTSSCSKTKVTEDVIFSTNLGAMAAHSSNRYVPNFLVPVLPPSNLSSYSIIDLRYELKFKTKVSGPFWYGFHLKTPFYVGTVPITESSNLDQRPGSDGDVVGISNVPSAPPAHLGDSPNLPPLSYGECKFSPKVNILSDDDDEHIQCQNNWTPRYPMYYFNS